MASNGDTHYEIEIDDKKVIGIGSFHKTLPHNKYGEVRKYAFKKLVKATEGKAKFGDVPTGEFKLPAEKTAEFVNPQAGLAKDRLTAKPSHYKMPPAPKVVSNTTAAEMTELYWMALLRDVSFDKFDDNFGKPDDPDFKMVKTAADEINKRFSQVLGNPGDGSHLQTGVDVPGKRGTMAQITPQNIFRLGLPGEDKGPFISQFFIRDINYGAQSIDQKINPYMAGKDYLTKFEDWLYAQNSGNSKEDGNAYNKSNEAKKKYYEQDSDCNLIHRYISTPRDLARFVNKDALHQSYFNAALLLLSGGARWTLGNPYGDIGRLRTREAGFGTLGGPHILALVSEVATRALKIVWYQKWQVNLRLRPEAYGGLVHVQNIGVGGVKRPYGLPDWVSKTDAAICVREMNKEKNEKGEDTLLLPLAFTAGSPAHPAYGAGHASVAGICITVLKAFFQTLGEDGNPLPLVCDCKPPMPDKVCCLHENPNPYLPVEKFKTYITGVSNSAEGRKEMPIANLTIEGELNKLAMNVAMGRSMGGVHWRTDNARSFTLGEAVAARVLADITKDLAEKPEFQFRTFSRKSNGEPKTVIIRKGKILVDGVNAEKNPSAL